MSSADAISVLLVDDHSVVREGYRALISTYTDIHVIAEADDADSAYIAYKQYQPDVIVMDINLPNISGIQAIAKIKKINSKAKILVFTMHDSALIANQAIQAGATGYITKSNPPETLINAIKEVHNGITSLSSDIQKKLALERISNKHSLLDSLSPREFEVLRLVVAAKSANQIAKLLNISPKTAANTHYQIKNKLGVANDIELTHLAIKAGFVNPDDVV